MYFPFLPYSMAGFITCNTNATNWQTLFPNIRTKLCTLGFHFVIPVFREIVLAWGKYIYILSPRHPPNSPSLFLQE